MDIPRAEITRDIYPMPAFVTFVVADLPKTIDWYVNALDFIELFSIPGPTGPVVVHLRRWRFQDILVRPGRANVSEPPANQAGTFSIMARIDDLDTLADRARTRGGGTVKGPFDTPWNTRDVHATDPDGYTVIYTAQRPAAEQDQAFNDMMRREAQAQGV